MRRPMAKKVFAASMAAAMTLSVAACGDTTTSVSESTETGTSETEVSVSESTSSEEEVSPYTVLKDENGEVYDLGGMEIIIRDWWSGDGTVSEPSSAYEEAQQEWREWIQETYNFTVKQVGISDWGSAPADFAEYATTGGDENYVFIIREDPAVASAVNNGLAYDLATLDCLDLTSPKYTRNTVAETWTFGDSVYMLNTGYSEPRTGIFFNKRVLSEAGIDPESIYDLWENGEWTWDKFDEICATVQRDTDNDGTDDIYGLTLNEGDGTLAAVFSNNACLVDKNEDGTFRLALEDANTLEALNWIVDMYAKYDNHDPEGAAWDYYKEEFMSGTVAFMVEGFYCGANNGYLMDMEDEVGFVMFPKGPQGRYTNVYSDNLICIPSCYDAEKAWNIAFAFDLWTDEPAGYEDTNSQIDRARNGLYDERAVECVEYMMTPEGSSVEYHGQVPNLQIGSEFTWNINATCDVSAVVEGIKDTWQGYIDAANASMGK